MTIVLGDNYYGKAETHVVRVTKRGATHDLKDLTVSVALGGDFADTHMTGDNSKVLPTDTQKNTVFAFAHDPIGEIEEYAMRLARHFVSEFSSVYRARVTIEEHGWTRVHDHAFAGGEDGGADHRVVAFKRDHLLVFDADAEGQELAVVLIGPFARVAVGKDRQLIRPLQKFHRQADGFLAPADGLCRF